MIDLIVTVCSLTQPMSCRDQHLLFDWESATLRSCVMQAQPYLAQWAGEHPDLRIVRYHCEWPEQEKQAL